ncbi:hypothetical protein O6H91_22G016100 [Diphasiastrum complanatum]|uniref:Uncharacterized protein n=1 Tax=Diphasiastrum complanatum TaxID=34168 RepID=A0ACC2AD94_DIPCM|nr:hypothetical protein O6H91_22G016100 [Diphasiastrum complanatum]
MCLLSSQCGSMLIMLMVESFHRPEEMAASINAKFLFNVQCCQYISCAAHWSSLFSIFFWNVFILSSSLCISVFGRCSDCIFTCSPSAGTVHLRSETMSFISQWDSMSSDCASTFCADQLLGSLHPGWRLGL